MKDFRVVILLASIFLCGSCQTNRRAKTDDRMPAKILWAWERAEDLRFLDQSKFGVAFLAQTLYLQQDTVIFRPRRQPLKLAENTYLIAVTRIETNEQSDQRPNLSDEQRKKIVSFVVKTLESPNVKAVQIDFDAAISERNFYKSLIADVQNRLPQSVPFSITALASWCLDADAWFDASPVDEVVPMAFVMGAQNEFVRDFLGAGNDWRAPACRTSLGISIDEPPLNFKFKPNRRTYYFKSSAWEKSDLEKIDRLVLHDQIL